MPAFRLLSTSLMLFLAFGCSGLEPSEENTRTRKTAGDGTSAGETRQESSNTDQQQGGSDAGGTVDNTGGSQDDGSSTPPADTGADTPVDNGGSTGDETPNPPTPGSNLSFATVVAPIFKTSCVGAACHSTAKKTAGYDLESYAGAKAGANKSIQEIQSGGMPISNYPDVSAGDLQKIKDWVAAGYPQ